MTSKAWPFAGARGCGPRASLAVLTALLVATAPLLLPRDAVEPGTEGTAALGPALDPLTAADVATGCAGALRSAGEAFVENLGQVADPDVAFCTRAGPLLAAFTPTGVDLALQVAPPQGAAGRGARSLAVEGRALAFGLRFAGASPVRPVGLGDLGVSQNFYRGGDPAGWVEGARGFSGVLYEGLYEGIDLRYTHRDGALKYEFLLEAGADAGRIICEYSGVGRLSIDPATGDLLVPTAAGTVRDSAPVVLQPGVLEPQGGRGAFVLLGGGAFGFALPAGCRGDLPLVIDPGMVYSSCLGGRGDDYLYALDLDPSGNMYVTGFTTSADFPLTIPGTFVPIDGDLVLTKLDPTGKTVLMSTYIQGEHADEGWDLSVQPDGTVLVVAVTGSDDLPIQGNAFNRSSPGGYSDGALMRFRADGTLAYCSYFGGAKEDLPTCIDVDAQGGVYISGTTDSQDMPCTAGAFCRTYRKPWLDAHSGFALKVNASLSRLDYCTYLNFVEKGLFQPASRVSQCVRPDGRLYVGGSTFSEETPTTAGAYRETVIFGMDTFVLRLDPTGSRVERCTLFGGSWHDEINSMCLGPGGTVIVAGTTNSSNLPRVPPGRRAQYVVQNLDAFAARFDAELATLEFSGVVGGIHGDFGFSVASDASDGSILLAGMAFSADLPCTAGCYDPLHWNLGYFLARFDGTTGGLAYLTYLGTDGEPPGQSWEIVSDRGMAVDGQGRAVIVGTTYAPNFTTTADALYPSFLGGARDGILMIIDPHACGLPGPPTGLATRSVPGGVNLTWDAQTHVGARVLKWRVYRGGSPNDTVLVKEVDGADNWTVDSGGLVTGVGYHYRLSALTSAGEGDRSSPVVGVALGPPHPPLDLAAASENGTVSLTWSPPGNDGGRPVLGYEVLRGLDIGSLSWVANSTSTGLVDSLGLIVGQSYLYGVRGVNVLGPGEMATVLVTVSASPPSPPLGLSIVAGNGRIDLGWERPISDGGSPLTGYRVYRTSEPLGTIWIATVAGLNCTDFRVRNGVSYTYHVTAENEYFEGAPSAAISEVPFGPPSWPLNVTAAAGDHEIVLTWDPPADDNGRPVTSYRVYYGKTTSSLAPVTTVEGRSFVHSGLTNGAVCYYEVSAFNLAGESIVRSPTVDVIPMGPPGPPMLLTCTVTVQGVSLSWQAPEDHGGGEVLSYLVTRESPGHGLEVLANMTDTYELLDATGLIGVNYTYRVRAFNGVLGGQDASVRATPVREPGPVRDLTARASQGGVLLTWSAPELDGGSPVEAYFILKGTSPEGLRELDWTNQLSYLDTDTKTGKTYYYSVQAKNGLVRGPPCAPLDITLLEPPGAVVGLRAQVVDGRVVLSWTAPSVPGCAPPTGYLIYRGASPDALARLADAGAGTNFTDGSVLPGNGYYYKVVAASDLGPGDPATVSVFVPAASEPTAPSSFPSLLVVGLLALLALVGVALAWRRFARLDRRLLAGEAEASAGEAGGPRAGLPYEPVIGSPTHLVEEVFVMYRDGRLMASCAREEFATTDAEIMSGMLSAVQGLIQDGLQRGGELESIRYGGYNIVLDSGSHVSLAVVVYGEPDRVLVEMVESAVSRIEAAYAGVIEDWNGDLTAVSGIKDQVGPLIARTAEFVKEEVKGVSAEGTVSILSAVDLYRGYVRLKVAAVNSTRAVIADASIEVEYDSDMLHLDRLEPATLARRDDRAILGSLMPGERKTVSFLFDPQICQGTHIDGLLTYVDSSGVRHRVDMKRRTAEVVCPIFFTREHANTAMLRRLITEGLRATDLRVLRYPPKLGPGVILGLAKAALGEREIQLVREYVREGPPFYAEVWYYGETKVKGYRIVMRLGVVEEKGVLELFAASTAMEPIAGLLAEFRRDLTEVLSREAPGKGSMEMEKDEDVHRWLAERQLLLDHIFDDEGPAAGKDGGTKGIGAGDGGATGADDAGTKG